MKQLGLVSSYTVAQFKSHVDKCNESKVENIIKRGFDHQPQYHVVVSDLTYVRVGTNWYYICILVDLFNRSITGYCDEKNVSKAFSKVDVNLEKSRFFIPTEETNLKIRLLMKPKKHFISRDP